jgi:hypothetical protein
MAVVSEAKIIWQYLRWHGQYSDTRELPIIKSPDFDNEQENDERLSILARDAGHLLRVRFPFVTPPAVYRWEERPLDPSLLESAFSNYAIGYKLLTVNEIAFQVSRDNILPAPFGEENNEPVRRNINRLAVGKYTEDFNAIILCRPTPGLPRNVYRVVEGSKRAIALRVAQIQGIPLTKFTCYLGDYE